MPEGEIRIKDYNGVFRHELMLGDEYVGGLGVHDLEMQVGVAVVRMGGIGGVETERKHRHRGYARRVLENSTRWMTDNDFDCAVLFGIPDLYDKFGYAVCLPDCRWEVRTREAERAAATLTVRPYETSDRAAVLDIYAANNRDLTGSIARDEDIRLFRKGSHFGVDAEAVVFSDAGGEIMAYAARDKSEERAVIGEVGARRPQVNADIVHWAAQRAVEQRVEKITFVTPPDSLFSISLARYGAEQRLSYPRNGNGMGRLINLISFFQKTLPEWTRRAGATRTTVPGASLLLQTDIGDVTLTWTGHAIEIDEDTDPAGTVRLPQFRLMQLVMGYYGYATALTLPEVHAHGELGLFHTLFPRRLPFMWPADHF